MAFASTVAVVVASPATSAVLDATCVRQHEFLGGAVEGILGKRLAALQRLALGCASGIAPAPLFAHQVPSATLPSYLRHGVVQMFHFQPSVAELQCRV